MVPPGAASTSRRPACSPGAARGTRRSGSVRPSAAMGCIRVRLDASSTAWRRPMVAGPPPRRPHTARRPTRGSWAMSGRSSRRSRSRTSSRSGRSCCRPDRSASASCCRTCSDADHHPGEGEPGPPLARGWYERPRMTLSLMMHCPSPTVPLSDPRGAGQDSAQGARLEENGVQDADRHRLVAGESQRAEQLLCTKKRGDHIGLPRSLCAGPGCCPAEPECLFGLVPVALGLVPVARHSGL